MAPTELPGAQSISTNLKNKMTALGMDLGGTKLSAALVSDYKVVSEPRTVATPVEQGPEKIVEAIVKLIKSFQGDSVFGAVGIATAGVVDPETGSVIGATNNLPGWAGTPLKKLIEHQIMLPVHVDNDANAAAYADALAMGLGDRNCVVGVTLGTGIGTGIIMKGRVFRGGHLFAGEGGHSRISIGNNRLCTCGQFDCWEAYGCGRGLVTTAKELLQNVTSEQSPLAAKRDELTTHMITEAAANEDIIAQKALELWHHHVAAGMINFAHILDPDCFIVSGGLSKIVDFDLLREIVSDKCIPKLADLIEIRQSALGTSAGIIGAAHIVLNSIGQQNR
jgi:glucokinase